MKQLIHFLVRLCSFLLVKLSMFLIGTLMLTLREKVGLMPNTPLLLFEVIICMCGIRNMCNDTTLIFT